MDNIRIFSEMRIEDRPRFFSSQMQIAELFFSLHSNVICYVYDMNSWYYYDNTKWIKDKPALYVMKLCKAFVRDLIAYVINVDLDSRRNIEKYDSLVMRRKLINDTEDIAPKSIAIFDLHKNLINCQNGTFNLDTGTLQPHCADDYITFITNVWFDRDAKDERWEQFIDEIMCGDKETARYLQKCLGYCLSGGTWLEQFYIFYGKRTRNGKGTLSETIAKVLNDYAASAQPQSFSRRPKDGTVATPDLARNVGKRFLYASEPDKHITLGADCMKQLTGGDTITVRFLNANPFEYKPQFKIFFSSNYRLRVTDETLFTSHRLKVIPFDRHFSPSEQDTGLKERFAKQKTLNAILKWLVEGHRLLMTEGLAESPRVLDAIEEYRRDMDIFGLFLEECTIQNEKARTPKTVLHRAHDEWAKASDNKTMKNYEFKDAIERRYIVRRDAKYGSVVYGVQLKGEGVVLQMPSKVVSKV